MNVTQKFVLKNQINKDGTQAILFRITVDRKQFYISTGIKIHKSFWHEKEYIKKSHPYHDTYNAQLMAIPRKLNKLIATRIGNEESFTYEEVKELYKEKPAPVNETFFDYCTRLLNTEGKASLSVDTIKNHKLHIKQVKEYAPFLTFNQITRDFLSEYEYHCRYELHNSINTVQSKLKNIRTYINKAIRDGIITEYVFRSYHLKTESTKPKFLSMEEFHVLEKYYKETTSSLHRKHLQYFLFACVSGLRYSDVKALRWSSISSDWIMLQTQKTKRHVSIPINDHVRKYLPVPEVVTEPGRSVLEGPAPNPVNPVNPVFSSVTERSRSAEFVFNVPSNQKANKYLKEIQEAAKISSKLTTHVARHTFATICLTLDMPLPVVSKLLGHSTSKTTEIYAKIIDKKLESEMKKWDIPVPEPKKIEPDQQLPDETKNV